MSGGTIRLGLLRAGCPARSASSASIIAEGTENPSDTVLPCPVSWSERDEIADLGMLRPHLQAAQRDESLNDLPQILRGDFVPRLGANLPLDAAVDRAP